LVNRGALPDKLPHTIIWVGLAQVLSTLAVPY